MDGRYLKITRTNKNKIKLRKAAQRVGLEINVLRHSSQGITTASRVGADATSRLNVRLQLTHIEVHLTRESFIHSPIE